MKTQMVTDMMEVMKGNLLVGDIREVLRRHNLQLTTSVGAVSVIMNELVAFGVLNGEDLETVVDKTATSMREMVPPKVAKLKELQDARSSPNPTSPN